MKRILIFITLFVLALGVEAQDRTQPIGTLELNQTLLDYSGVDADTLTANQDTLRFTFRQKSHGPILYNIKVQTTETETITGDYDIVLYGKVYSDDSWTKMSTTAGETTGGSFTFNSDEAGALDTTAANTAPFYRYFMIELDGAPATSLTAGVITLNSIYVKTYYR